MDAWSRPTRAATLRPVTLYIAASLDGFIARRDGSIDWLPSPTGTEDYGHKKFLAGIDTVVMGRRTFDVARQLESPPLFGGREGVVFSRRRAGLQSDRVRFIGDEPAETVRRLRAEQGRGIWLVGGGEIARECFEAGVVSEIILSLVPVLLGDGVPLFLTRAGTTWLTLRSSRQFPNGLVQLTYGLAARPPRRTTSGDEDTREGGELARLKAAAHAEESRVTAAAVGTEMLRAWALRASAA